MQNLEATFSNLRASFAKLAVGIGEAGLNDMVRDLTLSITEFVNSFTDTKIHTINQFFAGIADAVGSVAEAWNAITWLQGDGMLQQFERNNPSQIGNMAPAVPGGYQLGDLNRSNGNADYLNVLRSIEAKRDDKTAEKQDETNSLLREISDQLRKQENVAIAG